MPPKAKLTKEQIILTAFEMTRRNGFNSVTARELGKKMGTSASPIFTYFESMSELKLEVRKLAMKEFEKYVEDALNYTPAYKQFGAQMIKFATREPQLFRILYIELGRESLSFEELTKELGKPAGVCVELLQKDYDVSERDALILFRQTWIFTFSICIMIVNKICNFSYEEILNMLGLEFQGLLMLIKSGQYEKIELTAI